MPAPINPFKAALARGEVRIGAWAGLANPYCTEIMATAGFDWLVLDNEHAPNDLRSTLAQLQVLEATASHPVVRIPIGETWMVKQMLDAGAQTVLVPMIESGAQAAQMARAMLYPPQGVRGVGAGMARASKFAAIPDYLATANDQTCLLVQVESRAGLAALDDILAVEGVDGVFIGPADLSADMGHLGDPAAPEVADAIRDAITRIRAAGKAAGILGTDDRSPQQYLDWGANFVAVGTDVNLFAAAARAKAAQWKR